MSEEDEIVKNIFGWAGTGLSAYFFFAPIFPMIKILRGKFDVKDAPYILLSVSLINCILWLVYGLLKNDLPIYLNNTIGGGLTLIWITICIILFVKKKIVFVLGYIFILIIIFIGLSLSFYFFVPVNITGIIVMVINVLVFAAPGEKIIKVIKTYNYQLIPIFSTLGGLFCSLCWAMYGIYQNDYKVYAPNLLGLGFAIIQIIVYLIYYYKNKERIPIFAAVDEIVI